MAESEQRRPLLRRLFALALMLLATFAMTYAGWLAYRSARLYANIKETGRGYTRPINTFDPALGYRPIPEASSEELFACGLRVPIHQDAEGFRVPAPGIRSADGKRPFVLALGCSFTFGTGCLAEEAFPFLVADKLGGTALDAGVAGYGLAQMLLRARELIPRHKPEVVVAEYATWLIARSIGYASTPESFGRTPHPYFALAPGGQRIVAPPAFATCYFSLPMSDYALGKAAPGEFAGFLFRVGLPLWTSSDLQLASLAFKRTFRLIPPLDSPSPELVKAVYSEIAALCRANGSRLVIVPMGHGGAPPEQMPQGYTDALHTIDAALYADAYAEMYRRLEPPSQQEYEKAYGIWGCTPPVLIDRHPNPAAHRIIAETILKLL